MWVVSYGGKTIPRWQTAAILKIDILPYLSEKSSNFHEILYTAADFELDERHTIKNKNFQNSRWQTATILKIVILPYLSEKSSDFDEILYTAADFELDERHMINNEKVAFDRLRVWQNVFLVLKCWGTFLNGYHLNELRVSMDTILRIPFGLQLNCRKFNPV